MRYIQPGIRCKVYHTLPALYQLPPAKHQLFFDLLQSSFQASFFHLEFFDFYLQEWLTARLCSRFFGQEYQYTLTLLLSFFPIL